MRLSKALWADASRTRPERQRCAETGSCVPRERRSDLLLRHPGLTVVTRLSGARADSCNGNRRTQSPRLRVHLRFFVLAKNLGSPKKLGQDPGKKAFTCTAATTRVVPLSVSSSRNQA